MPVVAVFMVSGTIWTKASESRPSVILFDQSEIVQQVPPKHEGFEVRLESLSNPAHKTEMSQAQFDALVQSGQLLKLK